MSSTPDRSEGSENSGTTNNGIQEQTPATFAAGLDAINRTTPDQNFHAFEIRQEQAVLHTEALHLQDRRRSDESAEEHQQRLAEQISYALQLYSLNPASNMTPMERFLSPSPASDPNNIGFRSLIEAQGIAYGSMESIPDREAFVRRHEQAVAEVSEENASSSNAAEPAESDRNI